MARKPTHRRRRILALALAAAAAASLPAACASDPATRAFRAYYTATRPDVLAHAATLAPEERARRERAVEAAGRFLAEVEVGR